MLKLKSSTELKINPAGSLDKRDLMEEVRIFSHVGEGKGGSILNQY